MKFTHKEFIQFYNERKEEFEREKLNVIKCSEGFCGTSCSVSDGNYKLKDLVGYLINYTSEHKCLVNNITLEDKIFSVTYRCESSPSLTTKLSFKLNVQVCTQLSLF